MMDEQGRGSQLLFGLAALIAAVAVLVFALAYAGFLDGRTALVAPGDRPAAQPPAPDGPNASGTAAPASPDGQDGAGDGPVASPAATMPPPTADRPEPRGPTARQSPTAGPSPTRGTRGPMVVENWTRFADSEALKDEVSVHHGWSDNEVDVTLIGSDAAPGDGPGVALAYDIVAQPPNDYVGLEWNLRPRQDWRNFDVLELEVSPDVPADRQLVVQWYELSGEVWRHRVQLAALSADAPLRIPLRPGAWEWADWSENRNLALDLESVTRIGLFVGHTGPGRGELRVGTVRVVQGNGP